MYHESSGLQFSFFLVKGFYKLHPLLHILIAVWIEVFAVLDYLLNSFEVEIRVRFDRHNSITSKGKHRTVQLLDFLVQRQAQEKDRTGSFPPAAVPYHQYL